MVAREVKSRRLGSIWQNLGGDEMLMMESLSATISDNTLLSAMPEPMMQDGLVRWMGVENCVVLVQSVYQVWDLPLVHEGEQGFVSGSFVESWGSCTTWVAGMIESYW